MSAAISARCAEQALSQRLDRGIEAIPYVETEQILALRSGDRSECVANII